ncbi:MAG: hypothetical protein GXP33_07770, partial [Spirochaetes bacterium]|nr:hypothetical protein [Spirochaetota bacterium]
MIICAVLVVGFAVHFTFSYAAQFMGMGFIRGFDYAAKSMRFLFGFLIPIIVCIESVEALSKDYLSGMIRALFFENLTRQRILAGKITVLFLKVLSLIIV